MQTLTAIRRACASEFRSAIDRRETFGLCVHSPFALPALRRATEDGAQLDDVRAVLLA